MKIKFITVYNSLNFLDIKKIKGGWEFVIKTLPPLLAVPKQVEMTF